MLPSLAIAGVDLVINNQDTPDPVAAGGVVTYELRVENNSGTSTTATGVKTVHAVSADATYQGALDISGGAVTCAGMNIGDPGPGTLTCTLPDLDAGKNVKFSIQLKSIKAGNISLGATASATEVDDATGDNSSDQSTTVNAGANVGVSMTPASQTVASGSSASLALAVSNSGPDAASHLVVSMPVPTGFSVTSLPAACINAANTITCTVAGPIAVGGNLSIGNVQGTISSAGGSTITGTASVVVSSSAPIGTPQDSDASNNTTIANISVTAGTDLAIKKARSVSGNLLIGATFNFVLTPTYSGGEPSNITVTDTIPANYKIGTVASPQNGWTCTVVGQVLTCTRPGGSGAGLDKSLGNITIPVEVMTAGNPVNTANVSSLSPNDFNPTNNTATDGGVTIMPPTVDLGVSKVGPQPALVVKDVPFNYTLTASNGGNTDYYGTITLTDHLPAGLTYNGYSGAGWTCLPAAPQTGPANIACTRIYTQALPLKAGVTTPSLLLNATALATGNLSNGATITASCNLGAGNCGDGDNVTYNVAASLDAASADISLIKKVLEPTVYSGDELTYTLEIVNAGPSPSNDVELRDALRDLINTNVGATGAGYISAVIAAGSSSGGSCSSVVAGNGRDLTCTFTAIPNCTAGSGDCPVVTVKIRPGKEGVRSNTAIVVSNGTADPDHSNEQKTVSSAITPRVDVTVTKTASSVTVAAGQNLTYVVTAKNINNGMSAAANVTITDTLPHDVTYISATPSTGSCATKPVTDATITAGNDQLVCNLGSIAQGAQQTVTIVVRPNTSLQGQAITNTVAVATSTDEPEKGNNTASVPVNVSNPVLDLVLNKTDNTDPVGVGDGMSYTITVMNSGPSAAENVVVTDDLPTTGQLIFKSAVPSAGVCGTMPAVDAVGGLVSCNIGNMPAGTTRTVVIGMAGAQKGIYANTASVTSTEAVWEANVANNTESENTTVRTKADMQVVSKVPSISTVNLRDTFDYVITVRNNSANEAEEVFVTDPLPTGVELTGVPTAIVSAGTTEKNTCTGAIGATQFVCELGLVGANTTITVTAPVKVVAVSGPGQVIPNTATVTTKSIELDPTNNSATGTVTVNSSILSGRVFSDLNDDGLLTAVDDAGIGGVTITLSGTAHDGAVISRTVTTAADGTYQFIGVPKGTYQLAEGSVTAPHFRDGKDSVGTIGGVAVGNAAVNDIISGIVLPEATSGINYNFAEVPIPLIGIAKSAGAVTNNLDGTYSVTFTFNVTNAGNTPLAQVQINDTVAGQFGSYVAGMPAAGQYTISSGPVVGTQSNGAVLTAVSAGVFTGSGAGNALLLPAASSLPKFGSVASASRAQISFVVRFFPIGPGPFENTATVTGTSPTTEVVHDDSVDGATPDKNGDGDPTNDKSPTIVTLSGQAIGVAKAVGTIMQTGSKRYRIPYTIIVKNVSTTVTATNVQITDSLNATFPTAQTIAISTPATVSACSGTVLTVAASAFTGVGQNNLLAGNQTLQAGEHCTITFVTEVDFGANPLPAVVQNNQAIGTTAQTPGGTVIATDPSQNGNAPDPNGNGNANEVGENDPTPVSFAAAGLSTITGTVYLDSNHDRINNDSVSIPHVEGFIVEVLNSAGEIVGTATTAADGSYTIGGLYPSTAGDTSTYYTLYFREPVNNGIHGGAQSSDTDPARNGKIDNGKITQLQLATGITTIQQNLPLDPAGVIYDAVSRNPIPGASVTLLNGGVPVPTACLAGGLNTQVTGATGMYQFLLNNPAPGGCPGTATYTIEVKEPGGYLPPASTMIPPTVGPHTPSIGSVDAIQPQLVPPTGAGSTTYYFDFVLTLTGDPTTSSSNVVNNHIPLDPVLSGAIVMTKSTPLVNVVRSDLVPYTITATNTLAATLSNINVVDVIPPGFRYRIGSAALNGVHLEPLVTGRNLSWPNQTFASGERKTLRMLLVVGTGVSEGEYVNRVSALNSIVNSQVSNTATATVRVVPDPTFDCSDIIGKVFDDKNANGYQDQDEPGIANVRIATARGLLVTSDQDGRFHVACAAIPNADRGSNFVMKLDERTLPSGYRITTENPRDVRVTRGKMVKLNFGATVHRVIRLDISGAAFMGDSTELQASYLAELKKLPEQLQARPSVLRIAYRRGAESADMANKRVDIVKEQIKELWHKKREQGDENSEALVPLMIETEMEVAQ